MTLRNRGEPSGFANLAAPLMSAPMRNSTGRDLKLLKSLLETCPSAYHAGRQSRHTPQDQSGPSTTRMTDHGRVSAQA
jgi:hypothetical protein